MDTNNINSKKLNALDNVIKLVSSFNEIMKDKKPKAIWISAKEHLFKTYEKNVVGIGFLNTTLKGIKNYTTGIATCNYQQSQFMDMEAEIINDIKKLLGELIIVMGEDNDLTEIVELSKGNLKELKQQITTAKTNSQYIKTFFLDSDPLKKNLESKLDNIFENLERWIHASKKIIEKLSTQSSNTDKQLKEELFITIKNEVAVLKDKKELHALTEVIEQNNIIENANIQNNPSILIEEKKELKKIPLLEAYAPKYSGKAEDPNKQKSAMDSMNGDNQKACEIEAEIEYFEKDLLQFIEYSELFEESKSKININLSKKSIEQTSNEIPPPPPPPPSSSNEIPPPPPPPPSSSNEIPPPPPPPPSSSNEIPLPPSNSNEIPLPPPLPPSPIKQTPVIEKKPKEKITLPPMWSVSNKNKINLTPKKELSETALHSLRYLKIKKPLGETRSKIIQKLFGDKTYDLSNFSDKDIIAYGKKLISEFSKQAIELKNSYNNKKSNLFDAKPKNNESTINIIENLEKDNELIKKCEKYITDKIKIYNNILRKDVQIKIKKEDINKCVAYIENQFNGNHPEQVDNFADIEKKEKELEDLENDLITATLEREKFVEKFLSSIKTLFAMAAEPYKQKGFDIETWNGFKELVTKIYKNLKNPEMMSVFEKLIDNKTKPNETLQDRTETVKNSKYFKSLSLLNEDDDVSDKNDDDSDNKEDWI